MFRIKTDIRHYRCDSRDKVERLIRNWVIRPSDLIFDDEDDDWRPIGDDPAFVDLFASLAEKHDNQPETVVTGRAADKAAVDREVAPNQAATDRDQRQRTPRVSSASTPETSPNSGEAASRPKAAVLRQRSQGQPSKPVAPEGVEGVIRDSDEITIMTEKTFDRLSNDGPSATASVAPSPPAGSKTAGPTEETDLIERPDFDDEPGDSNPEPPESNESLDASHPRSTSIIIDDSESSAHESEDTELDDEASEDAVSDDGEPAPIGDAPSGAEVSPPARTPEHDKPSSQTASDDSVSTIDDPSLGEGELSAPSLSPSAKAESEASDQSRLRRHNLPEEVFVTAEIDADEETTQQRLDELADVGDHESGMGSASESRSQWNIILDEMPPDDEAGDAASDEEITEPRADRALDDGGPSTPEADADPVDDPSQASVPDGPASATAPDEPPPEAGDESALYTSAPPLTETPSTDETDGSAPPQADDDPLEEGEPTPDDDDDDEIDPLRDTDELLPSDRMAAKDVDKAVDDIDPLADTGDLDLDDDSPEGKTDPRPTDEPGFVADEEEIDETLDGAFEDLEESAIAARKAEGEREETDDDLEEIAEIEPLPIQDPDAVSMGYEIDFTVPIRPSERRMELGIERSYLSTKKRDRCYSRPQPKKSGELITNLYTIPAEREDTSTGFPFVVVAVLIIAFVVTLLVVLLTAL